MHSVYVEVREYVLSFYFIGSVDLSQAVLPILAESIFIHWAMSLASNLILETYLPRTQNYQSTSLESFQNPLYSTSNSTYFTVV